MGSLGKLTVLKLLTPLGRANARARVYIAFFGGVECKLKQMSALFKIRA